MEEDQIMLQLAVMAVPKMIILAIKKNQIMMGLMKAKSSKHYKNLVKVQVAEIKTEPEIIIEVIIQMVNRCDAVEVEIVINMVDPEKHVKIRILEVSLKHWSVWFNGVRIPD